ncbi:MAG: hypothetical protein AAF555_01160 [Verrucomicrobiota bacterium]
MTDQAMTTVQTKEMMLSGVASPGETVRARLDEETELVLFWRLLRERE